MHKIVIIFISISLNMCFGYSKELSHRDRSFEYPQHMFWLRNKKNNFQLHTLIWRPDIMHQLFVTSAVLRPGISHIMTIHSDCGLESHRRHCFVSLSILA